MTDVPDGELPHLEVGDTKTLEELSEASGMAPYRISELLRGGWIPGWRHAKRGAAAIYVGSPETDDPTEEGVCP